MNWIFFFIPGCIVTLQIGHYLREAFKAENMVNVDPVHKQYQVYDRRGKAVLVPLPKGIGLSKYTILTSGLVIVFLLIAIFVADKWWLPIVTYIGCELVCKVISSFAEYSYGSFLYHLSIILSPILLAASFIALFVW